MLLLLRIIRYVKGIGHSRGYGIQSPFAYNFIKALRENKASGNKTESLINHITATYGERVIIADATEAIHMHVNGNTVLVVKGIYQTKQTYNYWHDLCESKRVTASFDLYYLGVAFFEQGLSKKNYIVNC
ncbi:MAG: hypothetical protein Q4F34_03920 [Prevotellaceae bacterium]|nr:hypothetical protein [Prevotellaceae bacterium]